MELPNLAQWIQAEDGTLVDVSLVRYFQVRAYADAWCLQAATSGDRDQIILGKYATREQADRALALLTGLLEVALVSVDLDITAVMEAEAKKEGEPL